VSTHRFLETCKSKLLTVCLRYISFVDWTTFVDLTEFKQMQSASLDSEAVLLQTMAFMLQKKNNLRYTRKYAAQT